MMQSSSITECALHFLLCENNNCIYISNKFHKKIVVGAPTAPLFCAKNTMYRKIFIGY